MAIELLAPAGHMEGFFAAVENGADAVYLGLKRLSARASASNFTLAELARLVPYSHSKGVKIYVALNSILTAVEFPGVLDLLQSLSDIGVDAVIVQDPGIFFLIRQYFPRLRIHASTLMTIHNHAGVNQLERMGAERVVLARELTLSEIAEIAGKTSAELEVFVHGALCYSYSGLCLASSFRGGHSSLQGRCVQPCRLKFRQGKKEGFFLSCNDFCALPLLPDLKKLRISAFKIEGRMKTADYIAQVVKAYRFVLDAPVGEEAQAVAHAQEILSLPTARRLTVGALKGPVPEEILTPHRSGASGLWTGTVKEVAKNQITISLRHALQIGDRLRAESLEGKEQPAFTVGALYSTTGEALFEGKTGSQVVVPCPGKFLPRQRLFKVGRKASSQKNYRRILEESVRPTKYRKTFSESSRIWEDGVGFSVNRSATNEALFLKVGAVEDLAKAFQSPADYVLLKADKMNLQRLSQKRLPKPHKRRFAWSLPALIPEKDTDYFRAAVKWFMERGFRVWEINNWGHMDFFADVSQVRLIAGYRLNLRNSAALAAAAKEGIRSAVLSLEITRDELRHLARTPLGLAPILAVYAWPPLFSSRYLPKLQEGKPFSSAGKERYIYRKSDGHAFIYADRPVNWFAQLNVLRSYGLKFFMLDFSDGPYDGMKDFERVLSGYRRLRADEPYSLFNLERLPVPRRRSKGSG